MTDSVPSAVKPSNADLRDRYFTRASAYTAGLVRFREHALKLFGFLTLVKFGDPIALPGGFAWPITGGLLAARPGGQIGVAWRHGSLIGFLENYSPRLPRWLYSITQLPVHHAVTRRFLRELAVQSAESAA